MRIKNFIILNITGSIIELLFIMYILQFINIYFSLGYLAFFILIMGYQFYKTTRPDVFDEVTPKDNQFDQYIDLIQKTEAVRKKPLHYKYVKVKELPTPAFYHRNTVYINTAVRQDKRLFEGLLAHELGHASTTLGDVTSISVFRFSSILSNMIMMLRLQVKEYKNPFFKLFDFYLYIIFLSTSLLDEIILNPFMREDEYLANTYAATITDGRALRVYYYKGAKEYQKSRMKYDLKHPSVIKMLQKLETELDLSEHEKDVYAVGTKIYFIHNAKTRQERNIKTHNYYYHVLEHNEEVSLKLARNFEIGQGTKQDKEKALEFYIKAYTLGNKRVSINIAQMLMRKEQFTEALQYLEVAAQESIRVAFYELGKIYEKGLGVEPDIEQALVYYQQGADLKERRCMRKLSELL